jgi:AraC family transcriptional regulator, glycine betaine-responsive activator
VQVSNQDDGARSPEPLRVGQSFLFVLLPSYSFGALAAAVEPLRVANLLTGTEMFSWQTASTGANRVCASNGIATVTDGVLQSVTGSFDAVVLCGGSDPLPPDSKEVCRHLWRWYREGVKIGALWSGTMLLAKAGLLRHRRATIHWAYAAAFREAFPDIAISDHLFEIDDPIFTTGAAAHDLVLCLVEAKCGRLVASQAANHLAHRSLRSGGELQTIPVSRLLRTGSSRLDKLLHIMDANIEETVGYRELSAQAGLSARQVQRLFKRHLGVTPSRYFRKLRLQRARHLLHQTSMSITEVALATGFPSSSHFSRSYRSEFNRIPSQEFRSL